MRKLAALLEDAEIDMLTLVHACMLLVFFDLVTQIDACVNGIQTTTARANDDVARLPQAIVFEVSIEDIRESHLRAVVELDQTVQASSTIADLFQNARQDFDNTGVSIRSQRRVVGSFKTLQLRCAIETQNGEPLPRQCKLYLREDITDLDRAAAWQIGLDIAANAADNKNHSFSLPGQTAGADIEAKVSVLPAGVSAAMWNGQPRLTQAGQFLQNGALTEFAAPVPAIDASVRTLTRYWVVTVDLELDPNDDAAVPKLKISLEPTRKVPVTLKDLPTL